MPEVSRNDDEVAKASSKLSNKQENNGSSGSSLRLLLLGLLFHLTFIPIVFDCYFTSPVVNGMQHFSSSEFFAPAKRLVLIVGDGLRADLLFNLDPFPRLLNAPTVVAPYLRDIATKRGAFGISHTRVPTESRPGHVAIIAGMYEDVSAVTKGWKTNPVDFDSVFNQSSSTFSFGSPDILPMFAKGAVDHRVKTWCYGEEAEDFTKDATTLDTWVQTQLFTLLHNASNPISQSSKDLHASLHAPQTIIFLHLLGLDTTGHSYRPHSTEYMANIQVVDRLVREVEEKVEDFYGHDGKTAWVFTADHGMSARGNHGDGHPDNTRTPLIMWGAGVRGPVPPPADAEFNTHDAYSDPWGLSHLRREDVNQADITSLMASLIGANWPVNSVGVLPELVERKEGYLNVTVEEKAKLGVLNAKVILEHYRVKDRLKREQALLFLPFSPLASPNTTSDEWMEDEPGTFHLARLEALLNDGQWESARQGAKELIDTSLEGIRYLHTYDRPLLLLLAFLGYTGFSVYTLTHILHSSPLSSLSEPIGLAFLGISLGGSAILASRGASWKTWTYAAWGVGWWWGAAERGWRYVKSKTEREARESHFIGQIGRWWKVILVGVGSVTILQAMVLAYTHRLIWSLGFVLIGLVWPLTFPSSLYASNVDTGPRLTVLLWTLSCLVTAIFPALDVEKEESLLLIWFGALVMFGLGLYAVVRNAGWKACSARPFRNQFLLLLGAVLVTDSSVRCLQAKTGLPKGNQLGGWAILVLSILTPFIHKHTLPIGVSTPQNATDLRLTMYFLSFAPLFVILSISVEGLFYAAFAVTLHAWTNVERLLHDHQLSTHACAAVTLNKDAIRIQKEKWRDLQLDDVRIAVFFLFFVQVAFFGTGNVASISSFYLEPVYRLVPVFKPFIMAALLILKILAPYTILSAVFAKLNYQLALRPFTLFMIALSLTDWMTLTFFYMIRDEGSWLEIGQTISFFIISSLLSLWSAGICTAGTWLMDAVLTYGSNEETPGVKWA